MGYSFEPKIIICCDCKEEFVFTAAAQAYFQERGYTEEPKRCKSCHTKYKKLQRSNHSHVDQEASEVHYVD